MRVLDDLDLAPELGDALDPEVERRVRAALAAAAWRWFAGHAGDRVKVSLWIFRPSARVRALRPLFEWLFGPDPYTTTEA